MGLRIHFIFFFSISILTNLLHSQDSSVTIIAEKGDGIFSILRKTGINPSKYYGDFLDLNEKNIRNGSELIIGKTYFLPEAPDSFKNMGTQISVDSFKEKPIFNRELSRMKLKDTTLKNTVYYIMYSNNLIDKKGNGNSPNFVVQLASDLLIRGARVYVLDKESIEAQSAPELDAEVPQNSELGPYVGIVNKKYLMNKGSYQRLLFIQEKQSDTKDFTISIHHNDENKEGEKLANSLQDIFRKNWVSRTVVENNISPFKDDMTIYLSKNILPSVTTIDFNLNPSKDDAKMKSVKTDLAEMITGGILQDYSDTNFSD
ncbi:MAG: hypothetical protein WBB27_03290 [Maribacter sp.]